jgi:hypothetical protein
MASGVSTLEQFVFNLFYIFILFYFLQNRKANSFVRGVFITSCLFIIISNIIIILGSMLPIWSIEAIRDIFYYDEPLTFLYFVAVVLHYLGTMGYFLLAFGITFLIDKERKSEEQPVSTFPAIKGKRRNIGISLLLFVVTLGIYFFFWLYRTVKDLKTNFASDIPYTPAKAVGFLFIPLFNIYWTFYLLFSLPVKIKRIEDKYFKRVIGFNFHPVLIIILFLLSFVITGITDYTIDIDESNILKLLYPAIFASTSIWFLWLTLQAKLNAFFDYSGQKEQTM